MIYLHAIALVIFLTSNALASNVTNTSTPLPVVLAHRQPQHLQLILQQLQAEQAQKCEYGQNPLLFDICSNIDTLSLDNYHLKATRLEDLVSYVVRPDIIDLLQTHCKPGQWCFNEESSVLQRPLGKSLLIKHANVLCLFAGCFREVEAYVKNCVASEFSKSVLRTVPVICEASSRENEYCLEPALQLFHVEAAILGTDEQSGKLINV
jgi:hypothetical protein